MDMKAHFEERGRQAALEAHEVGAPIPSIPQLVVDILKPGGWPYALDKRFSIDDLRAYANAYRATATMLNGDVAEV